ncbi:MAG: ankyrin repeat domain-containing protein [Clostridia bacterium]|nr:ankyrin repeat domain-containing protein [Clostridia bacterium]
MKIRFKALFAVFALMVAMFAPGFCANAFHTPLHDAVKDGNLKDIKMYLDAHPEWVSEKDCTAAYNSPLFYAGSFEIVEYLVKKGADIHARNFFRSTPLHHLVDLCDERVVELLLEKGADINARNCYNETPLAHLERSIRIVTAFYMDILVPRNVFSVERFRNVKGSEYLMELYKFRDKLIAMGATF